MRILLGLAPMMVTASAVASEAPSDAASQAALAFSNTCWATRGQGVDATIASILAQPGVSEGTNLPAYVGNKPLRTFKKGQLEFLVRSDKSGKYGCFVALRGTADDATAIKTVIGGLNGVKAKPVKAGKKLACEWTVTGSKDEIRLVPSSDIGSILINLEVN